MQTYSSLKATKIPDEYILNESNYMSMPNPYNRADVSDKKWINALSQLERFVKPWQNQDSRDVECHVGHNYFYIDHNHVYRFSHRQCTGQLFERDKAPGTLIVISQPYNRYSERTVPEFRDYHNMLFNPLISPYSFIMTPNNYRVILDGDGNVKYWLILDNNTNAHAVAGLMILERTWSQHELNNNMFWNHWMKEDKLPFEAFLYFTHSAYGFINEKARNWNVAAPYSTFDMFSIAHNKYEKSVNTIFSAARLFQHKPHLDILSKIFNPSTIVPKYESQPIPSEFRKIKDFKGHYSSNILWNNLPGKEQGEVEKFEKSVHEIVNTNRKNLKTPAYYDITKETEQVREETINLLIKEIHLMLEKSVPVFLSTEVV